MRRGMMSSDIFIIRMKSIGRETRMTGSFVFHSRFSSGFRIQLSLPHGLELIKKDAVNSFLSLFQLES